MNIDYTSNVKYPVSKRITYHVVILTKKSNSCDCKRIPSCVDTLLSSGFFLSRLTKPYRLNYSSLIDFKLQIFQCTNLLICYFKIWKNDLILLCVCVSNQ